MSCKWKTSLCCYLSFNACNYSKRVLEAADPAYGNEIIEYITPQKLDFCDLWRIGNTVLSKGKSAITHLLKVLELLSSAPDNVKLFAKNLSENSDLDDSGISVSAFAFTINPRLHKIHVTSNLITNIDFSKAPCPDCILTVFLKRRES